jgi:hypothetical protein
VAIGLGLLLNWLKYPRVTLRIFNETTAAVYDVRVTCSEGHRSARCIPPGSYAVAEVESCGSSTIYISYRDANGVLRTDEPVYSSDDSFAAERGFIDVHLMREGKRVVTSIYPTIGVPSLTVHVSAAGTMTVE